MGTGSNAIELYKTTISTAPPRVQVTGKDFTAFEDNSDKSSFTSHPLFFVKSHDAWRGRVYCVVASHFNMLSRMEQGSPLSNNYVARDYILI